MALTAAQNSLLTELDSTTQLRLQHEQDGIISYNGSFWFDSFLKLQTISFTDIGSLPLRIWVFNIVVRINKRLTQEHKVKDIYGDFIKPGFSPANFDEGRYLQSCANIKFKLGQYTLDKYKAKVKEDCKGLASLTGEEQAEFRLGLEQFQEAYDLCAITNEKLQQKVNEKTLIKIKAQISYEARTNKKKKAQAEKEMKRAQEEIDKFEAQEKALKQTYALSAFKLAYYKELNWVDIQAITSLAIQGGDVHLGFIYNKAYVDKKTGHFLEAIKGFKQCYASYSQKSEERYQKAAALCKLHMADSFRLLAGTRLFDEHKYDYYSKAIKLFEEISPKLSPSEAAEGGASSASASLPLESHLDSDDQLYLNAWHLSALVKRAALCLGDSEKDPQSDIEAAKGSKMPFILYMFNKNITRIQEGAGKVIPELEKLVLSTEGHLPEQARANSDYCLILAQANEYLALNYLLAISKNSAKNQGLKDKFKKCITEARELYGHYPYDKRFQEAGLDLESLVIANNKKFPDNIIETEASIETIVKGYATLVSEFTSAPNPKKYHDDIERLQVKIATIHTELKLNQKGFVTPNWFEAEAGVEVLSSFAYSKILFVSWMNKFWSSKNLISEKITAFISEAKSILSPFISTNMSLIAFKELLDIYKIYVSQLRASKDMQAIRLASDFQEKELIFESQYITQMQNQDQREIASVTQSEASKSFYSQVYLRLKALYDEVSLVKGGLLTKFKHSSRADKFEGKFDDASLFVKAVMGASTGVIGASTYVELTPYNILGASHADIVLTYQNCFGNIAASILLDSHA